MSLNIRYHCKTFIIALCFFRAFNPFVCANTINLPEEYSSIQEAVKAASRGDVISVNQHDVFLLEENPEITIKVLRSGILVRDMDLTINGNISNNRVKISHSNYFLPTSGNDFKETVSSNVFVIDNSDVSFNNLQLTPPPFSIFNRYPPPVHILSGTLSMENVDFTGTIISRGDLEISKSIIYGDSKTGQADHHSIFNLWIGATPAIYCYNKESPSIRIDNSLIECDTDKGARALVFDGISNTKIRIANSIICSGTISSIYEESDDYQSLDSLWVAAGRNMGLSGILIANCTNVEFDLEGSAAYGGATYGRERIGDDYYFYPSGPGLEIIRSKNIRINGVKAVGGDGMHGGVYGIDYDKYHSGDGGAGIHITNSTVTLNNVTALGGSGGEGDSAKGIEPGVDGQPIYYDENSTVVFGSAVEDWAIYQ